LKKTFASQKGELYVDYGGANGDICATIGESLGITDKNQIVNVEISDLDFNKNVRNVRDVSELESSNSIGLLTAFHVIHHIPTGNMVSILRKLRSMMKTGTYFIIYEHDLPSISTPPKIKHHRSREWLLNYLLLIHFIYECIYEQKPYDDFIKSTLDTTFYSISELQSIIESVGFKMIAKKEMHTFDNSYYAVYQTV
jgi:hypothetical protein